MVGGVWRCLEVFGGSTQFILSSEVQDPPPPMEMVGGGWWLMVVVGVGWRWFMVMVEDG